MATGKYGGEQSGIRRSAEHQSCCTLSHISLTVTEGAETAPCDSSALVSLIAGAAYLGSLLSPIGLSCFAMD